MAALLRQPAAQRGRVFGVVEDQQPGLPAPDFFQPALERRRGWLAFGDRSACGPAAVERVALQAVFAFGAQPPDGGIAVAVLVAVPQGELRLADAAHAVDRRRRHGAGGCRIPQRLPELCELALGVAEVPAQRMSDDAKGPVRARRHTKARRGHPGHGGDQRTQANELRFPVGVAAVEGVHVHLAKTRDVLVQRRMQVADRGGGRARTQHRYQGRSARAGSKPQRMCDLAAHIVGLRQAGTAVDLRNPVGTDHHQHYLRRRNGIRQPLRKGLSGQDGSGVVEECVGVEPVRKAVMEPPGMAGCIRAPIADENLRAHGFLRTAM